MQWRTFRASFQPGAHPTCIFSGECKFGKHEFFRSNFLQLMSRNTRSYAKCSCDVPLTPAKNRFEKFSVDSEIWSYEIFLNENRRFLVIYSEKLQLFTKKCPKIAIFH